MKICSICESSRCEFLGDLKPYQDIDWHFEIFRCPACGSRFAVRDPKVNYYEILHATLGSSYTYHYDIAAKVRDYLETGRLDQCECYLKKAGTKYGEVIDFVKKKTIQLSILEIGCSTGFMTAFFRARGHEADGIDISETALRYANSSFGSFYSLSPMRESYDLIFHLGLIGCVDHPKRFLSESLRRLNSRGEMIFNAPNVKSPEQFGELWASTPPPDLVCLFHEKSFSIMLDQRFGAEVRKVYPKSEIIGKNLKGIFGKKYTNYPHPFKQDRDQRDQRILMVIKKGLKRVIWSLFGILVDLHLFKKYESEYGLIVTIHRRETGEHD
jgi:SAM-dependent methyltransferase